MIQTNTQTKKVLTRLKLVQWHFFQNETISFKDTNLLSGANGMGKSTILDAIQLILTTNTRYFNYAAANENSKRDLRGYVYAKTGFDDEPYLRKGSVISYVALEVYEEFRNRHFVIGAKIDAFDLETQPKCKWFCEYCRLEDLSFIVDNKPAKDDQFKNNGKKVTLIQQNSAAKEKFKRSLGNLQDTFFDLLPRSIAFKPMKDVKSFVSQFILPQKDIDTGALTENILSLKEMQKLVQQLKENADSLKNMLDIYNDIKDIDDQMLIIDILLKLAALEDTTTKILDNTRKNETIFQNITTYKSNADDIQNEINRLTDMQTNILAAIQTSECSQIISGLKSDLAQKNIENAQVQEKISHVKTQIKNIRAVLASADELKNIVEADDVAKLGSTNIATEAKNDTIIDIKDKFSEFKTTLYSKKAEAENSLRKLDTDIKKLQTEISDLKKNKLTYDANTTQLMEAISEEFKRQNIDSPVRIFADLLEIKEPEWQNAVEGYLNTQRFHIIVEPKHYDTAAMVYNRLKGRIHTAALVNTAALDINIPAQENSLAEAVESKNRFARAYANYLLGRVTRCKTVEETKQHQAAITAECMLYQRKALRKINPEVYRIPFIGELAYKRQLEIKQKEYDELSAKKRALTIDTDKTRTKLKALDKCSFDVLLSSISAVNDEVGLKAEISRIKEDLHSAENDPTIIELKIKSENVENDLKEKRKILYELKKKINKLELQKEYLSNNNATLTNTAKQTQNEIDMLCSGKEAALAEAEKKFEENKRTKNAETIYTNYGPRRQTLENRKNKLRENLASAQGKYQNGELGTGLEMMQAYIDEYAKITRHDLVEYDEKLNVIKENCELEFRENFLARMRENIEEDKRLFKSLNKTLGSIKYGNDQYRFICSANSAKIRLYEMITSDVNISTGQGFSLFSMQFDAQYHDEMNELFTKLTETDENGNDVINEYTDYRRYLDYDIEIISSNGKSQKFSKIYREKSGGETQTPYYVAIAASFSQIYSLGETIRVIILDEAFDKMDPERISSMMQFFKAQNFQVILAAPTTRLEIIGESTDNILMIYKDDNNFSTAEEFSYEEL